MNKKVRRGLCAALTVAMLGCAVLPAMAEDKKETVFVFADAAGETDHVIVSERLYNTDGSDTIEDVSHLEGIENVGGDQSFTNADGALVWQAGGENISYEGTSDAPLPVAVRMTYTLDGEPIAPADLAGKSGHLEINIRYEATQLETVKVSGKNEKMAVPFLMATVMVLDDEVYDNVQVINGKVVDAGNLKAGGFFHSVAYLMHNALGDGRNIYTITHNDVQVDDQALAAGAYLYPLVGNLFASQHLAQSLGCGRDGHAGHTKAFRGGMGHQFGKILLRNFNDAHGVFNLDHIMSSFSAAASRCRAARLLACRIIYIRRGPVWPIAGSCKITRRKGRVMTAPNLLYYKRYPVRLQ